MKKTLFSLIGLFLFLSFTIDNQAQTLGEVYVKHLATERKPVPYQYLREADVMWSKIVWRRICLTEKMNLPLYYPTEELEDRKSLIQLIMWGIKNKSLTPFQGDNFSTQYTMNDIDVAFGASVDTIYEEDDNGELVPIITKREADYAEAKDLLVKEMWFFDKQRSMMGVRIIGLCPIRLYYRQDDINQEQQRSQKLFWIYYPEARNIFAGESVYNPDNQATTFTFDDIFFKRRFSGYIYKESNVYDNRNIKDYTTGLDVMLESERVKGKIFDYEHDMWEY